MCYGVGVTAKRFSVRLERRTIRTVKDRPRVSRNPVAEGNCVTKRWGGEQPEAKHRSVGDEHDSTQL